MRLVQTECVDWKQISYVVVLFLAVIKHHVIHSLPNSTI